MHKEHLKLKPADHDFLSTLISKGNSSAKLFRRATALLELHRGKTISAVATWRDNYQSSGLQALADAPRPGRPIVIDGKQRASITALACSTPPQGHARWTLRMLADKAVELGHCEHLSHTAARSILKKTNFSRTSRRPGA